MARDLVYQVVVENQQAVSALSETERAVLRASKAGQEMDKAFREADKNIGKSFAEVEKNAKKVEAQIERLSQTTERKMTPAMGGLNNMILRYASGAVVLGAIKATADYADRLEELSEQTGIGITALSKFDAAARVSGSNLERVGQVATTVADRIAGGDRSVARGVERLGLNLDSLRRMRPEDQFLALARGIAAIEDPQERINIATDIGTRAFARMIPTLVEIAKNYERLPGLSDDVARSTGKISDAYAILKGVGLNVTATFLAPFAEALGFLAQKLREVDASKVDWSEVLPVGMGTTYNWLQDAYRTYNIMKAPDPTVGMPDWYKKFIEAGAGNTTGQLPEGAGLDTNQLLGYTNEIQRQLNDQLREQARLHEIRGKAAQEASKKAAQAAAEELRAFNDLIAGYRDLTAAGQARIGESFDLFFGRYFNRYGEPIQGQNYWGLTGPPTIPGSMATPGLGNVTGTPVPNPYFDPRWIAQSGRAQEPSAQSQWFQQWQAQYGNYSSWGEGIASAGNAFATYAPAIEALSRGDTQVLRATNIRGRGSRAKAGMMAGAAEGAQYGGPYGAMGGAVIGAIIGAARNPMFEDQMNRVAFNYDPRGISEDLGRQIEAVTKERFEKDRSAGEVYSLSDILKERPLDAKNITQMTARLRDAFVMKSTDAFDEDELKHVLDSSFGAFADYYNKIGGLADETFTEIISLQREFGVESAEVADYVKGQTQDAVTGLDTFFQNATVQSSEAATGLMGAAVLLFQEIKKGPEGLKGAMAELGPIIAEVDAALTKTGTEANVTFNDMRSLLGTMANEDVAMAVTAVEGLGDTMVGLHNAVLLNEDTYKGLARAVADTRNAIVAQGHDGEHVNRLMQADLQTIWELQQDQKYSVDEVTQALLDEAKAQGLVGDQFRSAEEKMVKSLEHVASTLDRIATALGADLPEAADAGARGIEEALSRIPRDIGINVNYNDGGYHVPDNERYDGAAQGGYVTASGIQYLALGGNVYRPIFRARGTDTVPAMLTPGEGVLSRRGMEALGELNRGGNAGGLTLTINVEGRSDEEIAEQVKADVLRELKSKRKLSRGRRAA